MLDIQLYYPAAIFGFDDLFFGIDDWQWSMTFPGVTSGSFYLKVLDLALLALLGYLTKIGLFV